MQATRSSNGVLKKWQIWYADKISIGRTYRCCMADSDGHLEDVKMCIRQNVSVSKR